MSAVDDIMEMALCAFPFDYRIQVERHAENSYLLGMPKYEECPFGYMDPVDTDEPCKFVDARRVWQETWKDCERTR